MPDDRPDDEDLTWEREEPLFGSRSRTGGLPATPPPPEEVFSGPLFDRGGGDGASSGTGQAPAGNGPVGGAALPGQAGGDARSLPPIGGADPDTGAARHDTSAVPDAELPTSSDEGPTRSGRAPRSRSRRSGGSFLRELPVLLLIAFVLAFLLRTFVLQVFYIPSSSMEPTLRVNDRMAVEKITYQFREPRRGEIVVFEGEELGQLDPDATMAERAVRGVGQFLGLVPASARDFVKRVIGLPGDEILIEDGQVFVNGEPIDEPYVVFHDGASYGPVTVPEDSLFFLGDNRPNSSDSRRGLGFVPMDDVVGRSVVIIWPPGHMGSLTGVEHEVADADPGG